MTELPAVSRVIFKACKIGTPLVTRVPSVRLKREIALSAELTARKLGAEIKQTNKALANLARKFDRFDDRITVQTRDQDQRLRKIERKRGA